MAKLDLNYKFDKNKNRMTLYDHRIITTSIYHNAFMQETIVESGNPETIELLSKASTESTLTLLTMYFNEHPDVTDKLERLKTVALLYQGLGYGILNLDGITENGGIVDVVHSNLVEVLKTKFNKNGNEECYYTNGFILGGISSSFQKKAGFYKIVETSMHNNYGYKIRVEEA